MKLQLRGKRFTGQYVKEIGPTLTLVTPDYSQAWRFASKEHAAQSWSASGGSWREVRMVK